MEQAAPKFTRGERWTDKYAFDKSDPATKMFVACSNWMDRAEQAESALRAIESALDGERNRFGKLETVLRAVDKASRDCLLGPTKLCDHDQAVWVNAALFAVRAALAKEAA